MAQRILVADDSITIQKVIGLTFANENYELEMADNGDEALEKALARRPDLVIADTNMPGLSGYDLCARLRSEPGLAGVPLILLAGTYEVFDDARAREVGANDHLTKPFESQALVEKVRSLLGAGGAAEEQEPELLDAEILEDADVLDVEPEPAPAEPALGVPATASAEDLDFGDVAEIETEPAAVAVAAPAANGGWDLGGFSDYTAESPSSAAPIAGSPAPAESSAASDVAWAPADDAAEAVIEDADIAEDEVAATPAWDVPAPEAAAPAWETPSAAEAPVEWHEPQVVEDAEAISFEDAVSAASPAAEFVDADAFDAPIAAPAPVPPAPDDLAWDDTMAAADDIADAVATAEDGDVFSQFAASEQATAPTAEPSDIEDAYAAFSAQDEPAAVAAADDLLGADAIDVVESADADIAAEPVDEAPASTEPDWNAPAWQADDHPHAADDDFVPASAAPVWADEPSTPTAPVDLPATSERLVDEARQQIAERLAVTLGSELGPLVEARVSAALDELLPRLIEPRLKAAVDQALAQALDDLKRRLG